uniref:DsRNase1 n=1 Tax=Cnaphalocrocis medinalis TaxID=437488 RepID=A0AB39C065_CNAME
MHSLVLLLGLVAAAAALPAMPDPSDLALMLNEEDFEDYLDEWLEKEEPKWVNLTLADEGRDARSGCTFRVKGDLGQPQPVYVHRGRLLMPQGNSGNIRLNGGEQIRIGCPGTGRTIRHPNINSNTAFATATCVSGNTVSGAGWLRANGPFGGLTCSEHPFHEAQATGGRCFGNHAVIRVGFIVDNVFHTWYQSCFDRNRLEVLYVWYDQNAQHGVHQTGVDRPSWMAGSFFPGVNINTLYTQNHQKARIGNIVGQDMVGRYITSHQFLARGHLTAKSDYPFASAQRATFYFINAAPQWQPFNAGNWNNLEQVNMTFWRFITNPITIIKAKNLRARIASGTFNTVIYTGTFGVTQLRDGSNRLRDIFLHDNGRQVPVPQYFYKVAYDAGRRLGTAFISINNPYYTAAEARSLQFCTDRCRNNNAFNWLRWQPDRIDLGYSFCCTIADFRRTITHIPNWNVVGLLS